MDFELFNYLVKSLSSTDKNITFDPNTSSTISVDMLSDRIRKIDPHADLDELQNLFEGRRDITAEELFHLFNDQRQVQLEPMKQSYAIFDEDGYLSETKLRKLMDDMGFEPLRPKDMAIMMESFDNDGDRRVSRKDFETVIEIAVQRCHPPK
jgi:Ca2+-binding EF-hand superfamily protein